MAHNSKIEWTETTWNPVTGCTKISEGCRYCYAEKMSRRLHAIGVMKYRNGFDLTLHPDLFTEPLNWRKSRIIFVCSMSDLFHKNVPDGDIIKIFQTMNKADHHIFQVLTKRSERLVSLAHKLNWTDNIWLGVTVESEFEIDRIKHLIQVPALVKFLSLEPLLSEIHGIPLDDIDWVIVGGESGMNARPIDPNWVRDIQSQCELSGVPFFFKQWGGKNKKKSGRILDGHEYLEMPSLIYKMGNI